ncbi:MAG TPA: hypothetical protein VGT43_03225 [Burkholderiales bacterium]|nr:hypothetical protein [Burkholderiales bacterium]
MSAAATAAGYLYASGRLRGRGAREQEEHHQEQQLPERKPAREEIRVAVLPEREQPREAAATAPKKAPKVEYRTRKRWTAE